MLSSHGLGYALYTYVCKFHVPSGNQRWQWKTKNGGVFRWEIIKKNIGWLGDVPATHMEGMYPPVTETLPDRAWKISVHSKWTSLRVSIYLFKRSFANQ